MTFPHCSAPEGRRAIPIVTTNEKLNTEVGFYFINSNTVREQSVCRSVDTRTVSILYHSTKFSKEIGDRNVARTFSIILAEICTNENLK